MTKSGIIQRLMKEQGYNIRTFADRCDLPYTSLYTILNRTGISKAGSDVTLIICKNLGITVEELDHMAKGDSTDGSEPSFNELNVLIARNGKKLSAEEKQALIKTLLSDD